MGWIFFYCMVGFELCVFFEGWMWECLDVVDLLGLDVIFLLCLCLVFLYFVGFMIVFGVYGIVVVFGVEIEDIGWMLFVFGFIFVLYDFVEVLLKLLFGVFSDWVGVCLVIVGGLFVFVVFLIVGVFFFGMLGLVIVWFG